jgi:trans-aconitate 2-methyltransferase
LEEYERKLKSEYPALEDGNVLLGYPRLFVVAVKK